MMEPSPGLKSEWHYHNPVRVQFGRGTRATLAAEIKGKRCIIVTSKRGREEFHADSLLSPLLRENDVCWVDKITTNPTIVDTQAIIDEMELTPETIIAFGGGSTIDSAKVLALALSDSLRGTPVRKLLENPDLHRNAKPASLYAVPTTAGTGSEVTPFATLWDQLDRKKYSLTGPAVFPYAALVDPELTDQLPDPVTLSTGLDAINQAAESIWNRNTLPPVLLLAMDALENGLEALPKLLKGDGGQKERDQMTKCSLFAGWAISQTRTAICHSISYPLTAHFGVPHGLACAFTMPDVLNMNLEADDGRFQMVADRLIGPGVKPRALSALFLHLHDRLEVASHVRSYIPDEKSLEPLIDEMITPGRADNNLAAVSKEDVLKIVTSAYRR